MRAGVAAIRARKRGSGRRRSALGAGCGVAGLALILAACGPLSAGSSSAGTTPVSGGTATYATLPGFPASYIFPFTGGANFTATNSDDFQYLMYRPLYWYGDGTQPYLNKQLSLADPPAYHNQHVTITLKNYKWSNGQPVTAQNVMFWINMTKAEKANWGGYIPGDFPDDVSSARASGTSKVVMTIKGPYSEYWFTYNELSQITPLPSAWDLTGPGQQSNCEAVVADCTAVYNYLSKNAGNPSTWTSASIWSIADGPWKVVSATNQDTVTLTYNTHYSGPVQAHHITGLVLEPFTSEQAEFNVLQDPQGAQKVDVGYLPTVDAPVPPAGSQVGPNPASLTGYNLSVVYPWELSYFPYNFDSPTAGPIFSQLYFRQAFQSLIDQEGVVDGPMHGYGKPTIGPVADYPITEFLSAQLKQAGDAWTLNPARAESLLRAHGWSINPGGVDTCGRAGSGLNDCGPGIKSGTQLKLSIIYASGIDYMESQVKELVSNASQVGIQVTETAESANDVIGAVFGGTGPWELAEWGAWTYSPDVLPTGEELFEGSSVDDGGHYNNAENNSLINQTLDARAPSAFLPAMYKWEDYLAKQLPVVYTPQAATLIETASNLYIGPQSPTLTINPEDWYYLK